MKKKLSILSILLAAVVALFAFAACDTGSAKVAVLESNQQILVIRADETKTDVSLLDVLSDLKENGEITYEESNGFISSLNGYTADWDNNKEYWAMYTTLASYGGVDYSSTEYGSYTYDGKVCGYANYGADGLPIIEGELYVIVLEVSNY